MKPLYEKLNFTEQEFKEFLIKETQTKSLIEIARQIKCRTSYLSEWINILGLKNKKSKPSGKNSKMFIDLNGKIIGKLLVLDKFKIHVSPRGSRSTLWLCRCECGKEIYKSRSHLTSNYAVSCGCYRRNQLPFGETSFKNLYYVYQKRAKDKNISFNLSELEFRILTKQLCYYCGTKPYQIHSISKVRGDYVYNGIDRINNNQGYIIDNCVSCCGLCNKMKLTLSVDEFISHITKILNYVK